MGTFWRNRVNAILLLTFGSSALLLAAMGLYAVLGYAVGRRRYEIAVRMAVGGSRRDVLTLVMREGLRHVLVGVAVGVGVTAALVRLAGGWLPGLPAAGLTAYVLAVGVVTAAAVVASIAPVRRATRVDPMVALREA
jgi:ABC-type antimicrobial peptide transport system permease subunit